LSQDPEIHGTTLLDRLADVAGTADAHTQHSQWKEWIRVGIKQRLFISCFILESQQGTLLARKLTSTVISGHDLPIPAPSLVWSAESAFQWTCTLQQNPQSISYVMEVSNRSSSSLAFKSLDAFQSALIISATHHNIDSSDQYSDQPNAATLSQILDPSTQTSLLLEIHRLSEVAPIREILAVSGESWILNEKVSSKDVFESHKDTVKRWTSSFWGTESTDDRQSNARLAVKHAIEILHLALDVRPDFKLTLGTEMGVYFAILVLWTITVAASARAGNVVPPAPISATPPPISHPNDEDLQQEVFGFLNAASSAIESGALQKLGPKSDHKLLKDWQDGVNALVKLFADQLARSEGTSGTNAFGELLDGVVSVLRKLSMRPWNEEVF
jgi:hypothetical protein